MSIHPGTIPHQHFGGRIQVSTKVKATVPNRKVPRERHSAILRALGPYEWLTLSYLALLNVLIVFFHRHLPGAPRYFVAHLGVALAMVGLCWAAERWPLPSLRFLRLWYPFILFIAFFEELHYISHLIFPRWFDHWLIAFDHALVGVHPTVWFEQFASPALTDFMQFGYLTYYFYTVVLLAILHARGEMKAFRVTITATAAAYILGYSIALVFPTEGPYHTLAALQRVELHGGPFTALVNRIQSIGRVHGAAFPSLHVAGAMVAVLAAWRYRRWLFWIFLPLFLLMQVSTVYGRYHYIADVLGGLLLGALGYAIGSMLESGRDPL